MKVTLNGFIMKANAKSLTSNARTLRHNMTKEELHLWCNFLKDLPVTVKRQRQIGNYIVDFYIPSIKLAIEIDGSQHYDEGINEIKDKARTDYLNTLGIQVIRYTNLDIKNNFAGVCEDILNRLNL